jgi:sugar-specific transcriptional regulator TrmB
MFIEILTNIGLSDKEGKVYLGLLELGTQPASVIAKKAGINRTTCYVILNNLMQKGLVTSYYKASITYFSAGEPDNLIKFLKVQKNKLERNAKELEDNIENLYQIEKSRILKPRLSIFEGLEGVKNIYNDILEAKTVSAFTNPDQRPMDLELYAQNDFHKKRIKQKIKLKNIIIERETPESNIRAKLDIKEIRTIPKKYAQNIDAYIYDNKLALIMYVNNNISGVIIESLMINQIAKMTHDIIWDFSS